jgi:hypothetical protein
MSIASSISVNNINNVSREELLYLLWLALVECNTHGIRTVGTFDPDETFDAPALLDVLDEVLGVVP